MHEFFFLLEEVPPDWNIPWAGIAAVLVGIGSMMTGLAALKQAKNQGRRNELDAEKADSSENTSSD